MSQPASAWQKSLRRSDVAIQADHQKRNPTKPSVGARRRSVDAIGAEKFPKNNLGGGATTKQPTAAGATKQRIAKLSIVTEEAPLVDDDPLNNGGQDEDVFLGVENKGAKPKRPTRSRKSTLGSVNSQSSALSASAIPEGDASNKGLGAARGAAAKAPSKKGNFLSALPKTPDLVSPLTPFKSESGFTFDLSPLPLPSGVKNIDVEDGTEWAYVPEILEYVNVQDREYASHDNYTLWRLKREDGREYTQRKVIQSRQSLMDWIIEVLHYMRTSQECLYNTVHIIDRYIWKRETSLDVSHVQLVGCAAILIASKLEEYYHANVKELFKLTAKSCTPKQITNMEMEVLQVLGFASYSLDPVNYINRFIVAAQREEDILFREACLLCLDCTIPFQKLWAVQTSKKSAAAIMSSLALIPNRPNPIKAEEELWHPTLQHYTGYSYDEVVGVAIDMLDILLLAADGSISAVDRGFGGVRVKFNSQSGHSGLLTTSYLSLYNIYEAKAKLKPLR